MITLPTPARRHWVSAFATVFTVFLALFGVAAGWTFGRLSGSVSSGLGVLAGLGLTLATAAAVFGPHGSRRRFYHLWARFSKRTSDLLAGYLTRLLFGVVTVAGMGGSRFRTSAPAGSRSSWTPKTPVPADAYLSQHQGSQAPSAGWSGAYLSWGVRQGRVWVWFLYPLIALLGAVQTQEKGSFGGNVYTLY